MSKDIVVITTNSMPPFVFESSLILGLPRGFRYRSRFPKKWIEPQTLQKLSDNSCSSGYITVRNWITGEVIPIRKIQIIDTKNVGDVLYIEYEVGGYFDYSQNPESRQAHLDKYNYKLSETFSQHSWKNTANSKMQPLVFSSSKYPEIDDFQRKEESEIDTDFDRWYFTVLLLKRVKELDNMTFLKFDLLSFKKDKSLQVRGGRYELDVGSIYKLRVFHILLEGEVLNQNKEIEDRSPRSDYMKTGPHAISIETARNSLQIAPSVRNFSGRYDIMNFTIGTPEDAAGDNEMAMVRFTVPDDIKKTFNPIFDVPIYFKRNNLKFVMKFLVMLVFIGIYLGLDNIELIKGLLNKNWISFFQSFSLVLFTLQIVDFVALIKDWVGKR